MLVLRDDARPAEVESVSKRVVAVCTRLCKGDVTAAALLKRCVLCSLRPTHSLLLVVSGAELYTALERVLEGADMDDRSSARGGSSSRWDSFAPLFASTTTAPGSALESSALFDSQLSIIASPTSSHIEPKSPRAADSPSLRLDMRVVNASPSAPRSLDTPPRSPSHSPRPLPGPPSPRMQQQAPPRPPPPALQAPAPPPPIPKRRPVPAAPRASQDEDEEEEDVDDDDPSVEARTSAPVLRKPATAATSLRSSDPGLDSSKGRVVASVDPPKLSRQSSAAAAGKGNEGFLTPIHNIPPPPPQCCMRLPKLALRLPSRRARPLPASRGALAS